MQKKTKDILRQIYNGEFRPAEKILPQEPEYQSKNLKIGEELKYFSGILNDTDKRRFEELQALIADVRHMESYANFAYGFKTGLILMYESDINDLEINLVHK